MRRGARRLVDAGRAHPGRHRGRGRLRLPRRRRRDARPRPAVAAPARRRARAVPHVRPRRRTPGPTTPGPAGQLAGSVIYELHVGTFTPEGTLDAALGEARPPARDRRRLRRADAGQRVQRHPQLGLRRRAVVRRPRAVRRPRGVPALRRRLPRGRARRDPGRRLQPPRPVGQLPADVRALPQVRAPTPGATWSTSTARAAPRCAATSSTTCGCGCEDFHVDGLRLDAVHALVGRLRAAPARGDGDRGRRAVGPPAPAADADRRVRPQRPAAGHAARGAAATAWTPSGATTSTTPCTSR